MTATEQKALKHPDEIHLREHGFTRSQGHTLLCEAENIAGEFNQDLHCCHLLIPSTQLSDSHTQ